MNQYSKGIDITPDSVYEHLLEIGGIKEGYIQFVVEEFANHPLCEKILADSMKGNKISLKSDPSHKDGIHPKVFLLVPSDNVEKAYALSGFDNAFREKELERQRTGDTKIYSVGLRSTFEDVIEGTDMDHNAKTLEELNKKFLKALRMG